MPLSRMAQDEGVTPIILHHLVKGMAVTDSPPELESIAFAGFQEWARQWMLLSRREKYDPDHAGHHELWFMAGGSAGHSVGHALNIEEGNRNDRGGRRWDVEVLSIAEARNTDETAVEADREQAKAARESKQTEPATIDQAVDATNAFVAGHVAAHSTIGKMVGLTAEQIMDSRRGTAVDSKADALVKFARRVVDERGRVSDLDLADARVAGLDDAALAEVVANVALNVFTNYFNHVAETDIDFPKVEPIVDHHEVCASIPGCDETR